MPPKKKEKKKARGGATLQSTLNIGLDYPSDPAQRPKYFQNVRERLFKMCETKRRAEEEIDSLLRKLSEHSEDEDLIDEIFAGDDLTEVCQMGSHKIDPDKMPSQKFVKQEVENSTQYQPKVKLADGKAPDTWKVASFWNFVIF